MWFFFLSISWNKVFCAKLSNAAVVQQPKKRNKAFTHQLHFYQLRFYVRLVVCPFFQFTLHLWKSRNCFCFSLVLNATFSRPFFCQKLPIAVRSKWTSIAVYLLEKKTRLSSFCLVCIQSSCLTQRFKQSNKYFYHYQWAIRVSEN